MERIYFDKQIFSYMFKGDNPVYQKLLSNVLRNKDKFLFCYSHAHLLDLKNDKTPKKYEELIFMEQIVEDNYLAYDPTEKATTCFLAGPREAFEAIDKEDAPIEFDSLFEDIDEDSLTEEQRTQVRLFKEIFYNQKVDFGFSKSRELPSDVQRVFEKILPVDEASMTLFEWVKQFMEMLKAIEEDKTVYKGLRSVTDAYVNNGKFTVDYDDIDFNDDLKNSPLQKSFIDYVNSNLNPNGDKEVTEYDFYHNAYLSLDMLGISKDSKKVKFTSLLNDGHHSYYGAFCDYVVSVDQGFLKKTRALYRLLGIETKVYHIDEFISKFLTMELSIKVLNEEFFKYLTFDTKLLQPFDSEQASGVTQRKMRTLFPYFGYFNTIQCGSENGYLNIYLSRVTKNYSKFTLFREHHGLVENIHNKFGYNQNGKEPFDSERELVEIFSGRWMGRVWTIGDQVLQLAYENDTGKLVLIFKTKVKINRNFLWLQKASAIMMRMKRKWRRLLKSI